MSIITNHHDRNHCFKETRDGTVDVRVVGEWIPRSLFGHFQALCSYIRLVMAAMWLTIIVPADDAVNDPHVVIIDQVSAPIPVMQGMNRLLHFLGSTKRNPKLLFYCHFPDRLLTPRRSFLKKLYRFPIDWIEEFSTGCSDCILVNSRFTQTVFRSTFTSLSHTPLQILYPSVRFDSFDKPISAEINLHLDRTVDTLFLSINRFERKKNLDLAIKAFKNLIQKLDSSDRKRVHLIIAGGYDDRVQENVDYFQELNQLVSQLENQSENQLENQLRLTNQITFLKSPSDEEKRALLHSASSVIYTPANEHFGIVPLEAMYMKRPVIAVASGGPLETIVHGETGFLCSSNGSSSDSSCDSSNGSSCGSSGGSFNGKLTNNQSGDQFAFKTNDDALIESFSNAMMKFVRDKSLSREMGLLGHERVKKHFSFSTFQNSLHNVITQIVS